MDVPDVPARKLAIFDIDGTIAVKGKIPASVVAGLGHIQSRGYLTTVSTGRSYRRLRDALGTNFEAVISPDALIIAEHGTKILHRDGRIVQADYFTDAEKDHFVDFIQANGEMVTSCMYALPEPDQKLELWIKRPEDVEKVREKRGDYARVFHSSYEELRAQMLRHEITHTLAHMEDFVAVQNLRLRFTRSKMDVHFMDGYMQFVPNFSDKAKAVLYLEQFHGIKVDDMLVAGNGINDVEMLNLDAGKRILVGPENEASIILGHLASTEGVIRAASPEALGEFLQKI